MSKTLDQIFIANPSTTMLSTDLLYLVHSPFTSGQDSAITFANFAAAIGSSEVSSITGTANQVIASSSTGAVTLSLPQSIATSSSPTFAGLTLGTSVLTLGGSLTTSGAFASTFTMTGATSVTFPTSGTLATTAGTVASVSGTTNRITSTGGTTPVIDISASYVGQSSLTTLGTIATGVWNGTVIGATYGGTGVNNGSNTLTLAGNLATSGAFASTFTMTGPTSVTFPTSGTLSTTVGTVTSVSGTSNRITSTGGATPVIDISASYVGQSSITTLGTIGTGIWQGTLIGSTYGGTGVNNGASTITLGGSLTTSGAFSSTFTMTGATNVTFPTSGTLSTTTGTVTSVSGTSNRITSTGGNTPVIDISASYVGQSSITTLGTIATGVWNGTLIGSTYGGTGVNNGASTITLGGNLTLSGAFATVFNITAGTNVTFPTSGTLSTTTGTVTSVSGTTNRITSTGGATPVIDISASYVGQSSITTLGTIATGVWNGTTIAVANGGTGITSFGTGVATALGVNVGSAGAFVTFNGALGTPSSGTLTSATGLPVSTGISGLGTGVATALAINTGSAGAFAATNANNTFTVSQQFAFSTLTDASTVAVNLASSNNFNLTLGGNRTLGVPTNPVAGQSGLISVRQDITGSRTLAYTWPYMFVGGAAPTLSTGKLVLDQLMYMINSYSTSTVTMTIATPCVVTWTAHGLVSGQRIQFTTTGALPTGLSTATTYWITVIDANTFNVSTSLANAQAATFVATSGSQSGTQTATNFSITLTINPAVA